MAWANLSNHRELATKVQRALSHAQGAVAAGLEATEIRIEAGAAKVKKRPALRDPR